MPRRMREGLEHAGARRRSQEATVQGLVAGAVLEAHAAHAAPLHNLAGSARTFRCEAAFPAVRALNGAGAPTLLPAMNRVFSACLAGALRSQSGPLRALYGANVQPVGPAPVNSGCPAADGRRVGHLPPQQRPGPASCPEDAAPYLNQARATYPEDSSELDAALHLLHPRDEELEVGEVTIFVEDAGTTPFRPRPTNPVYDGTRPAPHTPSCARLSPES